MKYAAIIFLLITPLLSHAGPYDGAGNPYMGMDPAKMQQMVMEMQSCMQNINMDDMEKLKVRGQAMEQEIKTLCRNGERDKAMSKAMAFSKEISDAPELAQIRKCSEKARSMMPNTMQFEKFSEENFKNSHVCDGMK